MLSKTDYSTLTDVHPKSGLSHTTYGRSDATSLALSTSNEINLTGLDSSFSIMGESLTALFERIDLESASIRTLSNTTISGSEDGYIFIYKGSGFSDFYNGDSTEITIKSIQIISREERLEFTGNITYDYESEQYSGYYTSYVHTYRDTSTDSYISFTFKGNLTADADTGNSAGGTLTSLSMEKSNGYKYAIVGNFTVDSKFEVTDGPITSLNIQDTEGNYAGWGRSCRNQDL